MKEEQLFHEALAEPAERRADFIDAACGEDADLRQRVEVLLQAHDKPGSFLNTPAQNVDIDATIALPVSVEVGSSIGPYKIREQIGEGGMGVVFVAEQTEPIRRKVALKIIKPGMDTKQVIARFEAERQTLTLMDNPNIARVHDAGATDTGRPYFVMELVRGLPITEYCDKHQLSTKDRLTLFITVCRTVQHAHLRGIIHRDLKPSNVLVTRIDGEGVPKVIDFGVAKATNQQLTERSIYTHYSQMVGTPLYMSPEQAEMSGVDIDTRTDVYSLGVLLYELLTGCTPFDRETMRQATHDEMRRIIREDEPLRPSLRISTLKADAITTHSQQRSSEPRKLALVVRGELDWIVMRALDKDRNRRYESASAFAADVERYLTDEPVAACPPSSVYRLQKYARKNKGCLTTVGLVLAALLIGTGVSLRYAFEANKAAAKSKASELAAKREKANALTNLNLATAENERAEEYMQTAFDAVDQLSEAVLGGNRVVGESGATWENEVYKPLTAKESELLETALTLYTRLANSGSDNPHAINRNALAFKTIGRLYRSQGMEDKAVEAFEQAAERLEGLTGDGLGTAEQYQNLGAVYYSLAYSPQLILNRATFTTRAKDALNRFYELEPDGIDARLFRATEHCEQGNIEIACAIVEKAARLNPNDGTVYRKASGVFFDNGRKDLGVHYAREAVRLEPDNDFFLGHLAYCLTYSGQVDEAHELSLKLTSRAPRYFGGFTKLSTCCFKMGEYENALEAAQTAVELNPVWEWTYIQRGTAYMACGDFAEGFRDFERAQEIYAFEPPKTQHAISLVLSAIQGKYGESKVEKAREFLIRQVAEDPLNELWQFAMADSAKHDGDAEAEIASLQSGIELLRPKVDHGKTASQAQLRQRLGQLAARLNAAGHSDEARVFSKEVVEMARQELKREPENTTLHAAHARLLAEMDDAEAMLTAAIEEYPQQYSYLRYRGAHFKREGDFDRSIADYTQALALAQGSYEQYGDLHRICAGVSEAYFQNENYQKAVDVMDPACNGLKGGAGGSWIYKRRAAALFELGRYEESLTDLSTCLERSPEDISAVTWIGTGRIANCADEGFRTGVRNLADRAVELHDQSADSLVQRVQVLVALDDQQQARKDLDAALATEDAPFSAWYWAALFAASSDDLPGYQKLCQQMLSEFESSENAVELHFVAWTCALACDAVDDYSVALQLAQKAVAADAGNQQYISGLGALQFRAGQFAAALESLSLASNREENGKISRAYTVYFRAMTEWQLDRKEDARKTLKQANELAHLELDSADDPPVWNRRLTLELLGKEAADLITRDRDREE